LRAEGSLHSLVRFLSSVCSEDFRPVKFTGSDHSAPD
jgi:hypothetical protein